MAKRAFNGESNLSTVDPLNQRCGVCDFCVGTRASPQVPAVGVLVRVVVPGLRHRKREVVEVVDENKLQLSFGGEDLAVVPWKRCMVVPRCVLPADPTEPACKEAKNVPQNALSAHLKQTDALTPKRQSAVEPSRSCG